MLSNYFAIDSIQQPDVRELLALDATTLSPHDAAIRILEHIEEVSNWMLPATKKHLNLG